MPILKATISRRVKAARLTRGPAGPVGSVSDPVNFIQFNTDAAVPSHTPGLIFYDKDKDTFSFYVTETEVSGQLNEEAWVRVINNTGSTILNGQVVYISGHDTVNDLPEISLANAHIIENARGVIGVATHDIETDSSAASGKGIVTRFGVVRDVDLSAFNENDVLYLDPTTPGTLTNTRPAAPHYAVRIGQVMEASTASGDLLVDTVTFSDTDTGVNIEGALNGIVTKKQGITILVDSGTIYADVINESDPTSVLPFLIDGVRYDLDTLTGAGVGGAARVALTAGTVNSPQVNFLYIYLNAGVPTLASSPTFPLVDFAWLALITLLDVSSTDTDGALVYQRTNNSVDNGKGDGVFNYITEKIRRLGASYGSGVAPTVTIDSVASPDGVKVSTTAGIVYQLHAQTFDVQDGTEYYIVNHPTTPFKKISNLNEIDVDAQGDSLLGNNSRFGLNIIGGQNSNGVTDRLYILLPNGNYASDIGCINDNNNLAVTSVPSGSGLGTTAFRICRVCLKYTTAGGGVYTNILETAGQGNFQDERGFPLGQGGGGAGSTSGTVDGAIETEVPVDATAGGTVSLDTSLNNVFVITADDTDFTVELANFPSVGNARGITIRLILTGAALPTITWDTGQASSENAFETWDEDISSASPLVGVVKLEASYVGGVWDALIWGTV
jgi:hypothetical protein